MTVFQRKLKDEHAHHSHKMGGRLSTVYLLEMVRDFPLPSIIRRDHFAHYGSQGQYCKGRSEDVISRTNLVGLFHLILISLSLAKVCVPTCGMSFCLSI